MMLVTFKICSIILILIITVIAGYVPFRKKIISPEKFEFPSGEALASGVFLGAALMHMLGDATTSFTHLGYEYPIAFLLAGITFLLLLLLEHLSQEFYQHMGDSSKIFAIVAVIMLSIHSFLAGAALGLSTDFSTFVIILVAILAHKWAASFALAIQLNKSTLSTKRCAFYYCIFILMTPLGILFGTSTSQLLQHYNSLTPTFTALAAGTFLYLGSLHGLSRATLIQRCCNLKQYSFVILGFTIMAIIAIWT